MHHLLPLVVLLIYFIGLLDRLLGLPFSSYFLKFSNIFSLRLTTRITAVVFLYH